MKTKNILLILMIGCLMSSCFIKSLNPFYTKKDLVFDNQIIGTWLDADSSKWLIKQQMKWPIEPDSSYQVEIIEKNGNMSSFNAHLFLLNKELYFDFFPSGKIGPGELTEANIVLTHSLAKIGLAKNHIKIQWFNEVWFEQLLKENKIRIRHEKLYNNDQNSYLLTASTEELQKFILKYGDDPQAFKAIWEKGQKDREKEALTFDLRKISDEVH